MRKGFLTYEEMCKYFPIIWGGRYSYMTLQLLYYEFPSIWGKFDFLFYQCVYCDLCPLKQCRKEKDGQRRKGDKKKAEQQQRLKEKVQGGEERQGGERGGRRRWWGWRGRESLPVRGPRPRAQHVRNALLGDGRAICGRFSHFFRLQVLIFIFSSYSLLRLLPNQLEPVFVNLLRSLGIDSQAGWRQP